MISTRQQEIKTSAAGDFGVLTGCKRVEAPRTTELPRASMTASHVQMWEVSSRSRLPVSSFPLSLKHEKPTGIAWHAWNCNPDITPGGERIKGGHLQGDYPPWGPTYAEARMACPDHPSLAQADSSPANPNNVLATHQLPVPSTPLVTGFATSEHPTRDSNHLSRLTSPRLNPTERGFRGKRLRIGRPRSWILERSRRGQDAMSNPHRQGLLSTSRSFYATSGDIMSCRSRALAPCQQSGELSRSTIRISALPQYNQQGIEIC